MHVIVEILVSISAARLAPPFFPSLGMVVTEHESGYINKLVPTIKVIITCHHLFQAKRDPYRFRFPIEMRFIRPNIDHLMYVILDFDHLQFKYILAKYGGESLFSLLNS